ncbi:indolepyruvate oxidoreductase subunit beta [Ihubacter massiliensis]|uniref:Indolepyruvate oxidoreductase subunit beta n=1 Tax=Hominibacterium faecale TaxID=2839743 RepID=A0A9J6QMG5_9FIRM|nr:MULTISPECIES: indolepyruvate oxidoreductase subunit beta [Eubacteriales Family XIII. Incertae Sedis]MCI7304223.1 indolepyruvate oxidoreductase subunit beta [Clostridia bacterium]MCO7122803.1 indolepyruvate oxidoreductase subunit beta [Ihubacter massiliensis]MCU7377077.1 indolepyruvate oxidoreductase subunit beta [Hominibacterium faecale]MDY3012603.1 indolepyruvate oxidoreductase subunit beta [Clostridiales Family XIII bacterium]
MKDINILIVGVGGQGTLLASVLLGNIALEEGYDVKLAEVHGMAQRGGSVVTHVRISENEVRSPLIEEGGADVIVAFEELEAYRWIPYLKQGGAIFVNTQQIKPMPVIMGAAQYPAEIVDFLKDNADKVTCLDALGIATECGSIKAVNTVLLGAMAKELPFSKETWIRQIEKTVKPKFVELNKTAFEKGYQA